MQNTPARRILLLMGILMGWSSAALGQSLVHLNDAQLLDRLKSAHRHPLVVHVWATWCKPCVAELPALAAAIKSKPSKQVLILAAEQIKTPDSTVLAVLNSSGISVSTYRIKMTSITLLANALNARLGPQITQWQGDIPVTYTYAGPEKKTAVLYAQELTEQQLIEIWRRP